jgi:serine protease inhibitor ecotin
MIVMEEELDSNFLKCDYLIKDPSDCSCKKAVIGGHLWAESIGDNEFDYFCSDCAFKKLHPQIFN